MVSKDVLGVRKNVSKQVCSLLFLAVCTKAYTQRLENLYLACFNSLSKTLCWKET